MSPAQQRSNITALRLAPRDPLRAFLGMATRVHSADLALFGLRRPDQECKPDWSTEVCPDCAADRPCAGGSPPPPPAAPKIGGVTLYTGKDIYGTGKIGIDRTAFRNPTERTATENTVRMWASEIGYPDSLPLHLGQQARNAVQEAERLLRDPRNDYVIVTAKMNKDLVNVRLLWELKVTAVVRVQDPKPAVKIDWMKPEGALPTPVTDDGPVASEPDTPIGGATVGRNSDDFCQDADSEALTTGSGENTEIDCEPLNEHDTAVGSDTGDGGTSPNEGDADDYEHQEEDEPTTNDESEGDWEGDEGEVQEEDSEEESGDICVWCWELTHQHFAWRDLEFLVDGRSDLVDTLSFRLGTFPDAEVPESEAFDGDLVRFETLMESPWSFLLPR